MKETLVYALAISEILFYLVLVVLIVRLILTKSEKRSYLLWAKLSYQGNIYTPMVAYPKKGTGPTDVRHWIEVEKKRLVAENPGIPTADKIDVLDIKVIKV